MTFHPGKLVKFRWLGGRMFASAVAHSLNLETSWLGDLASGQSRFAKETHVQDRAVIATVVGAVVGGAAGYLFFTDHGRQLRKQLEPALDDFARELNSFRGTVQRAASVASEGWRLLNDALGE